MQLYALSIQFLFNNEGLAVHILDGVIKPCCGSLAKHWGKGAGKMNLFIRLVQSTIRIPKLMSDFFQIGTRIEEIQG